MDKLKSFLVCLCTFSIPFTIGFANDISLLAPDGTTVEITRDEYGVPHIVAQSEVGVFFGQGFAAAQDRLYQMFQFRLAARGEIASIQGTEDNLNYDKGIRTIYYTEQERLQKFNALPTDIQTAIESYKDGVNTYLDSMAVNPNKYKPLEFYIIPFNPWKVTDSIAIIQFILRNFGESGGNELTRLAELQTNGQAWLDENRPINDPAVPTTIPANVSISSKQWKYSGIVVDNDIIQSINQKQNWIDEYARNQHLPAKLGSFAVLITGAKSNTGNVMLLGAPQMGGHEQNIIRIPNEVELQCPTLHAGGMIVAGMPGIIIGRNDYFSWTLTSGFSDNVDVYIDSTQDNTYGKYWYNGEWQDFEVIEESISFAGVPQSFTHYRTVHGPVFGEDLANHQVFSKKMTFWNNELAMMLAIFGIIRASNLEQFEAAAELIPVSFNLFYAGKDQNVKYWHVGHYQDRSDGVDPRLPHKGDGTEEWGGMMDFSTLPSSQNPSQGYFVNWNNKPVAWWNNGDNVPFRSNTDPKSITWRVLAMQQYVGPINSFSFEQLKDTPRQIQDHGSYQQALEFGTDEVIDENVLPSGQSGFVSIVGVPDLHKSDQWPLHVNWEFKDMIFAEIETGVDNLGALPSE
ncbi:penicillin acylase family protein, partial [candidate division KSB1 bacterium]|nr:penicillin acylase family protein [candidate division KSB1 bacterium]